MLLISVDLYARQIIAVLRSLKAIESLEAGEVNFQLIYNTGKRNSIDHFDCYVVCQIFPRFYINFVFRKSNV